jgi:hypothetical protein
MHESPPRKRRQIPIWLPISCLWIVVLGAILVCAFAIPLIRGMVAWAAVMRPVPCVEGGPGETAIFSNGGTQLFTFPQSASNIDSSCYTFQSAGISVWFNMDPAEQAALIDSMRWEVSPVITFMETPNFGNPSPNADFSYWEYSDYPEGAEIWIDTSSSPNRVFIYVWLD